MENELNKWIAEVLFEGCWHDWRSMGPNWGYRCGKDCGKTSPANYNPDYCNDLNLASLAEAKAIEKVGWRKYGDALFLVFVKDHQVETLKWMISSNVMATHVGFARATALQRCTAVRAAVEGK